MLALLAGHENYWGCQNRISKAVDSMQQPQLFDTPAESHRNDDMQYLAIHAMYYQGRIAGPASLRCVHLLGEEPVWSS